MKKQISFKIIKFNKKAYQSHLVENLNFEQVKFTQEKISEGSFGFVEKCLINSKTFAVKKIKPRIEKATLYKEIDFLNKMYLYSHKPKVFPKYFGYAIEISSILHEPTGYDLFFEFCEFDLRKKLLVDKSLTFDTIKQYFYDLIRVFCFLQSKGWAHRDIKPDNLLIDSQNQIKIIAFGTIEKFDVCDLQKIYEFIGTNPYKSPEFVLAEINKEKTIHVNLFKADVFSLGLVGLEMGGVYDSENFERLQTINAFQNKIKQCLHSFKRNFKPKLTKMRETQFFLKS